MSTWLDPIQHRLCSRSRCQLPIAGVGEAYGLCDGHGHEERNRRLAERDAKARAVTQRPIVRGLTVTPVDRPLSAIVGARPTPPIQPSAATVAAKEPPVPKPLVLKPNADALPPTVCRIADCDTFVGDGRGARGLCSRHHAAALKAGRLDELALPSTQRKRQPKARAVQAIATEAGLLAVLGTLPPPARGIVERLCTEAPKLRQDLADAVARAEAAAERSCDTAATNADLRKVIVEIANKLGVDGDAKFEDVLKAIDGLNQKLANQARANTLNLIADQPSLRRSAMEAIMDGRDEAIARAEAAEKALAITLESLCADLGIEQSDDAEWVLGHVTDLRNAEREGLAESIAVREALGIDPSGDYDLIARAREVVAELATVRAERDAARHRLNRVLAHVCIAMDVDEDNDADRVIARLRERISGDAKRITALEQRADTPDTDAIAFREAMLQLFGIAEAPPTARLVKFIASQRQSDIEQIHRLDAALIESLPWCRAAKECAAALGASTPAALLDAAKALSLDQHPPATIQRPALPALPESKPHRVKQAGGRDLGVLVGHVTESGLFRVTSGPMAGAVYGCLYSAEPVDRPVLGEPTPDRDVWVRTCIDEVTPHNIHTADGGRFRRSEWGPDRFAPVAKSTASTSPSSSAAVGEDDIPF